MSFKVRISDTVSAPETKPLDPSSIRYRVKQSGITSIIASFLEVPSVPSKGRGNPPNPLTDFGAGDFCSLRIADRGVTTAHGAEGLKQQIASTGKVTLPLIHQYKEMAKVDLFSSKITELDLRKTPITPEELQTILTKNQSITTIHLTGNWVDNNILGVIGAWCPRLESLSISSSYQVGDEGLKLIARGCSGIHTICVEKCLKFTDRSLEIIANRYPKLIKLSVLSSSEITDKGIEAVANNCSLLTNLHLSSCWIISDVGIQAFASKCHQLKELTLEYCSQVSDMALEAVAKGCTNLEKLTICSSNFTDKGMEAIGRGLHNLRSLDFSYSLDISDKGVEFIALGCPLLMSFSANCLKISDQSVLAIVGGCRELSNLYLLGAKVSDIGIEAVAKKCVDLKTLVLSCCNNINDKAIDAIANGCPNLQFLTIYACQSVNESAINNCLMTHPRLARLIYNGRRLTKASVHA